MIKSCLSFTFLFICLILTSCRTGEGLISDGSIKTGMSMDEFRETMLWKSVPSADPFVIRGGGYGEDYSGHKITFGSDRKYFYVFSPQNILIATAPTMGKAQLFIDRKTRPNKVAGSTTNHNKLRSDDSWICSNAVVGNPPRWRNRKDRYVKEAKRREITCGIQSTSEIYVADVITPIRSNNTSFSKNIFMDATDLSVCLNINSSKAAKKEAASRKLVCNASQKVTTATPPAPKPTSAELTASQRKTEQLEAELLALKAQQQQKQQIIASDTMVPLIDIISVSNDALQGVIKGRVTDNTGIAEVQVDGRVVSIDGNGNFTAKTYIPAGGKSVIVQAADVAGLINSVTISISRSKETLDATISFESLNPLGKRVAKNKNALALIIGVENYELIARAIYADSDAKVFADYATQKLGIPSKRIKTLVNNSADESGMLLAVKDWLSRSVKQGDTDVYIFFAGHGLASDDGEQMYLLPYDSSPRLLEKTAILRQELFDNIASANPRSVTVFLDTCYSGTTRGTDMLIASRPIGIRALEQSIPDNFTVMTAAAGDQTAKPLEEAKHGMFSYFLMKGMEGEADANNDNQITAGELHAYVQENVVQQSSGSQTPELQGDASRVLVRFQ
jgi:hypothetical protein